MSTPDQFARVPDDLNGALLQGSLVVVIGVGMVGSQVAEGLARFRVARLRLIDYDTYEMENTLRHALPVEYVGWNKALALGDWLPKQVTGLKVEAIVRKIDDRLSDDELDSWLGDADLIVAATDDRQAQRRIGHRALANEVAAIFPAIYPRRGGGEVIVQLEVEWPCFGCWDYFRDDAEQLRGARALDLDAQPVIFQAEQVCLGILDPGSKQHDLLRGERAGAPPQQVVMLDRVGVPSFGSLPRRPRCPSCGGGDVSAEWESPNLQRVIGAPINTLPWEARVGSGRGLAYVVAAIAAIVLIVVVVGNANFAEGPSLKTTEVLEPTETPYVITLQAGHSLAAMIRDSHLRQSRSGPITTRQFPDANETGKVHIGIVPLEINADETEPDPTSPNAAYQEAVEVMRDRVLQPATLPELLALAQQHPGALGHRPVVELGSLAVPLHGESGYVELYQGTLRLHRTGEGFAKDAEFAVVPIDVGGERG